MKSFSIKVFAIVFIISVASCSKDALRTDDSLQQLDAVEDVNDAYLLSSVIKQTALFYQKIGLSRSPGFPVPFNIWKEITRAATITIPLSNSH